MMMEKLYLCSECKSKVSKEHIRFDMTGVELVCDICFTKKYGMKGVKKENSKPSHRDYSHDLHPLQERHLLRDVQEGGVTYVCHKCHYKFMRKKGFTIGACPNCGQHAFKEILSTKAQELIDSVDNENDYY